MEAHLEGKFKASNGPASYGKIMAGEPNIFQKVTRIKNEKIAARLYFTIMK